VSDFIVFFHGFAPSLGQHKNNKMKISDLSLIDKITLLNYVKENLYELKKDGWTNQKVARLSFLIQVEVGQLSKDNFVQLPK